MKRALIIIAGLTGIILGCGGPSPAHPAKIAGPAPDELSIEEINAISAECSKHGFDDPTLKYARAYCAGVSVARDIRTMPGGRDYKEPKRTPIEGLAPLH